MRETSRFFSWCSCTGSGATLASLACGATFLVAAGAQAENADCCTCQADINKDGTVDGADLGLLLAAWLTPGTADFDFCEDVNGNGNVDGADLGLLLAVWNSCVPSDAERCQGDPNCPNPAHDCCSTGTPGCSDAECCNAVCAADSFCCAVAWDGICVDEAQSICGITCPTGGICPNPDHDCCSTGTPGCSDADCCNAVCAVDSFCCAVAWDGICVGEAVSICGISCTNSTCPNPDHDCFTTGTVGCSDADCCNAVCAVDSFCCAVAWDGICVAEALSFCGAPTCPFECSGTDEGEACGDDTNGGCNVTAGSGSNCCFANGGIGCDDAACQSAVCAVDSFCCAVAWDGICAAEAQSFCPTLCAPNPPGFGSISCGETICATAWADGNFRDTDWYVFSNGGAAQEVVLSLNGTLPMIFGKINTTDCATASAINPFATTGLCGSGSLTICVDTGDTWFFAAPNTFSGFPCGSNNGYSLSLECTGVSCDPSLNPACGDNADHDCCTQGNPGCTDADCCNAVCAVDSFCCQVAWDGICVAEAVSICGISCQNAACPNPEHDCFTTGGVGCSDADCCNAVCIVDSFCCSVAWDGICVAEAISFCGAPTCPFECSGTDEGEACGDDTNGGCNVTAGSGSNCCFGNGGIGCDDAACQSAVCAVDSFCCAVAWDGICAAEAQSFCPTLCAPNPPGFGSISCGETICGTAWADGNFRDTDWFVFTNGGAAQEVTMTVNGTLPLIFGKINSTDCATASAINPFATTGLCGSGSLTICADSGDTWLFVAPNVFAGFPCGSNNGYSLTVECTGVECDPNAIPGCPNPDHDCFTTGTPGCSDADCCNTVCSVDSFCCQVAWDGICVAEAFSLCGGGTGSNCCFANGGIGCDDAACQSAVCAADSFCCAVAWDGICASEAASLCEVCGGGGTGGASNCCTNWGGLGCDDAACQSAVCAADSFCCAVAWDSICAGEAATLCGTLCN